MELTILIRPNFIVIKLFGLSVMPRLPLSLLRIHCDPGEASAAPAYMLGPTEMVAAPARPLFQFQS